MELDYGKIIIHNAANVPSPAALEWAEIVILITDDGQMTATKNSCGPTGAGRPDGDGFALLNAIRNLVFNFG